MACIVFFGLAALGIVGWATSPVLRGVTGATLFAGFMALLAGALLLGALVNDPFRGSAPRVRPESDATLAFTVGTNEPHRIVYRWDQFWGWLTVTVDGELVSRQFVTFSLSTLRVVEFEVGASERHRVRIEKTRPVVASFARAQPATAFIDGIPIATTAPPRPPVPPALPFPPDLQEPGAPRG